jgi:hypothetical protein
VRAAIAIVLALAACTPTPIQKSGAQIQMEAACNGGNLEACAILLGRQDRQAEAQRASMPDFSSQPTVAETYSQTYERLRPTRQPAPITPLTATQKVCPDGMIVAATFIC